MKAISIRQPYAEAIVAGVKTLENRTWSTAYRGKLAIVASKTIDPVDIPEVSGAPLLTGCVIGVVDLVDIVRPISAEECESETDLVTEADMDWYVQDSIGWILRNPRRCRPVPIKGRLGLYDIPDDLVEII